MNNELLDIMRIANREFQEFIDEVAQNGPKVVGSRGGARRKELRVMEKGAFELNRGTAAILATVCIAVALLSTSCGGGRSMAADPISAAGFSVSPTTVAFGNQAVGTTSTTQTATLTNAGNATLTI